MSIDQIAIGRKVGRLMILKDIRISGRKGYLCKCDCGVTKAIRRDALISGATVSCGCYGREARLKSTKKHGFSKSAKTKHPLYSVWDGMVQRCTNPNKKFYYLYGGRGINVCESWRRDFLSFYHWAIANGYEKGKQLDRINNDSGYSSNNCRWVTSAENARNKRNNLLVEFNNQTMCLQDVSNQTGINRSTLYYRLKHDLPLLKHLDELPHPPEARR